MPELVDLSPERQKEIIDLEKAQEGKDYFALLGLKAGAPSEVRRVLTGEWPVNVVNKAVKGKNRAGL